jgi:hypothetical protein
VKAQYRTGRHNGHTLYYQGGDTPADTDAFVGSCVSEREARAIVDLANQGLLVIRRPFAGHQWQAVDPS